MPPELLFKLVNGAALPFWALMLFAPGWRFTRWLMSSLVAPALFACLYAILITPHLGNVLTMFGEPPDLARTQAALSTPEAFVVAWVHYLAFDLFVGRWEYLDATEKGVRWIFLAPSLFLTLMLGPLGFLVYLGLRSLPLRKAQPMTTQRDTARQAN